MCDFLRRSAKDRCAAKARSSAIFSFFRVASRSHFAAFAFAFLIFCPGPSSSDHNMNPPSVTATTAARATCQGLYPELFRMLPMFLTLPYSVAAVSSDGEPLAVGALSSSPDLSTPKGPSSPILGLSVLGTSSRGRPQRVPVPVDGFNESHISRRLEAREKLA